ncbi:MAG TPA: membrane protein insertion efficiency factor YidD [Terriglobales bacterium]|nr:membrane protein insertion efficiency factor YidD [Terriglobales bacterium]
MKAVVQFILRMYKRLVSPMLPHCCRFVPTCSEYAMEAVEQQGVLRGGLLAIARLLRCHPLARAGYDPVPVKCCSKATVSPLAAGRGKKILLRRGPEGPLYL